MLEFKHNNTYMITTQRRLSNILALMAFIAPFLGLWIHMQVKDAEHDMELKAHKEMISDLKAEVKEDRAKYDDYFRGLSDKLEEMPQKIITLMNSSNRNTSKK